MPILEGAAEAYLDYGGRLPEMAVRTPAFYRDREHTKMFIVDIQRRYPAAPPMNLVKASMTAINRHARITMSVVRAEISAQEQALALAPTPQVPAPAPAGSLASFLANLESRRGAYKWIEGTKGAFAAWVNGANPLEHPLPDDATINCWEAVLVSALESGRLTAAAVQAAYAAADKNTSVYALLTANGVATIDHTGRNPTANTIQAGQVIMIAMNAHGMNTADWLHHVVVAVAPNPADYHNIEVIQLWNDMGGNLLARTELEKILIGPTTLRYATL